MFVVVLLATVLLGLAGAACEVVSGEVALTVVKEGDGAAGVLVKGVAGVVINVDG